MARKKKEVHADVSEMLQLTADTLRNILDDGIALGSHYTEEDVENACSIFVHVLFSVGAKKGRLTLENHKEFGNRIDQLIEDITGFEVEDQDDNETDEDEMLPN